MEAPTWEIWGRLFIENSKALGSQIVEGVVQGATFVAEKTKEGAVFVAEKTKEGVSYVAEQAKPATYKIIEGASFLGDQIKNTYEDVKTKIIGEEQQPNQNPNEEKAAGDNNNNNQQQDENSEISKGTNTTATTVYSQNSEPSL